jgi:PLP dependent protein
MTISKEAYQQLKSGLDLSNVKLVAVSKTRSVEDIRVLYEWGHRDFGENYVQELADKQSQLPTDIRWHFIGHLQSNKVKQIVSFVQLIQGVDSLKLLEEINRQGAKQDRIIDCLLQVHIAEEETKFGLNEQEVDETMKEFDRLTNVKIRGLMGMASFTDDMNKVRKEFQHLKRLFDQLTTHDSPLSTLSMGMSHDYKIALEEGSTMVRIGSLLFGEREKKA